MARKKLLENILSLGAVQLVSYLLPFLTLPYLAQMLGPAPLGRLAFALSIAQIMLVLTDYGFNLSAPKAIAIHREDRARITQVWCAVTVLRAAFVGGGILLVGLGMLLVPAMRHAWDLISITYLMVVGNVLFPQWLFQGLEQLKRVSMLQILARVLTFGLMFVLVKTPNDLRWAAMLQAAGTLLGGLLALPLTLRALDASLLRWPRRAELIEQLTEGWHVFLSTAAINIYTSCNAFLLGLLVPSTSVGNYHIAEKFIRAAQMVFSPICNATYPHISRKISTNPEMASKIIKLLLLAFTFSGIVMGVAIIALSDWLVVNLFGKEFPEASQLISIMSFTPLLIALSNVLGIQTMLPLGMSRTFSQILIASAFLDLLIFFPAVRFFGTPGAATTAVIIELSVTLAMAQAVYRNFTAFRQPNNESSKKKRQQGE